MGTKMTELEKKQKELKKWIKEISYSQNQFAQHFYNDTQSENEEETKKFQETFKKQLSRKSTPIQTIQKYLDFLFGLPSFEKLGYIKPSYIENKNFSEIFNKKMLEISKKLTDNIKEEY